MSCRIVLLILIAGAVAVGGALLAGGYNVSAAAGHLPPVKVLLHWTMHNSVSLRAGGPVPEDLEALARARAGAGHYDLVCRECHGTPEQPLNAVARAMEPPPPHILEAVQGWSDRELFWIVNEGIKMTAMPAWPARHREDEVWSMVAFLKRLPGMNDAEYRRLVLGPLADRAPAPPRTELDELLIRCARCHGMEGEGMDAVGVPRLDGLTPEYLHGALEAYAGGDRASGIMAAQASALAAHHLKDLAEHYGQARGAAGEVPLTAPGSSTAEAGADAGERIARHGIVERNVPACAACHGPAPYLRAASYPALAGQDFQYLVRQLELFKSGHRGGSAFAPVMRLAVRQLEDHEIRAVARYYSEMSP